MTRSQVVAAALVVSSAIFSFLLTQPDVVLPPLAKVLLGALQVGVTSLSLVLKISPPPAEVKV